MRKKINKYTWEKMWQQCGEMRKNKVQEATLRGKGYYPLESFGSYFFRFKPDIADQFLGNTGGDDHEVARYTAQSGSNYEVSYLYTHPELIYKFTEMNLGVTNKKLGIQNIKKNQEEGRARLNDIVEQVTLRKQKEKEEKLKLQEQQIKAAEEEKLLKEKELREQEEELRKEELKKKRIQEEREIELRRQDEEQERIKEENRRLKEWEDKFDKEHRAKEEELIRKFYNNELTSQNHQENHEDLDLEANNNNEEKNK